MNRNTMTKSKLRVIHANHDWSVPEARTDLYDFEAVVGADVELITNEKHPGGVILRNKEALKAAILRGDTRYEEIQTWETTPPQIVTCRWVIGPAPTPKKKPFWLFTAFDRKGNAAGGIALILVISILAVGAVALWRSDLAMWIRMTLTAVAIPLSLIVSILSYLFVANLVSRNDIVSRSIRCPNCGKRMRLDKRQDSSDGSLDAGRFIRQTHITDYFVCRKCGYERRLN